MGNRQGRGPVKSSASVAIGPSASAPVAASYLGVSFKTSDPDVIAIFNSINSSLDNYRKTGFCPKSGRKIIVSFNRAVDAYFAKQNCSSNVVMPSGGIPLNWKFLVAASGAQPGGVLVNCTPSLRQLKCEDAKALFAVQVKQNQSGGVFDGFYDQIIAAFNIIVDRCCVDGVINQDKCKRLGTAVVAAVCWEMSDTLMAPILADEPGV